MNGDPDENWSPTPQPEEFPQPKDPIPLPLPTFTPKDAPVWGVDE